MQYTMPANIKLASVAEDAALSVSIHRPREERRPSLQGRGGHPVHKIAVEYCEIQREDFRQSLPRSLAEQSSRRRGEVTPIGGHGEPQDNGEEAALAGELGGVSGTLRASFDQDEISLGPKLGSGEFSDVYEIASFRLSDKQSSKGMSAEDAENRRTMKEMERYHDATNSARYALKRLKDSFLREKGPEEYIQACGDLALEAEFLATLSHPHIVRLRGLTHAGVAGYIHGPRGYFLIIDRLVETLDGRIERWHGQGKEKKSKGGRVSMKKLSKGLNSLSLKRLQKGSKGEDEGMEVNVEKRGVDLMDECLFVGLQIAAALAYLHQHSIIFRDLKPQNIGFDVRGDVKIFDFGLARFMPKSGDPNDDKFEMSGAGSPRYMAPELLAGEEYNLKADTYTFSLVLWEMLTGKAPYSFVRRKDQLIHHVCVMCGRPEIDEKWPSPIQDMLESGFEADMAKRPPMEDFFQKMRKVLIALRGSDEGLSETFINCRRTALSLAKNNNNRLIASFRDAAKEEAIEENIEASKQRGSKLSKMI